MNKAIDKTELLSPAGSIDAFYQALYNGADAIYLGGDAFGARAFATNFSNDDIEKCVKHAHLYGKKVYITVNTLISDTHTEAFIKYIAFLNDINADAVIVQDLGMAAVIKDQFPDLALHASTQLHNHNVYSLRFLEDMGFKRAVLARECRLSEIAEKTTIEKEVFVHGALCISYSGQCLMSAMTMRRSGNQGACAQNCRMRYDLYKKHNNDLVKQATDGQFILSPKDLGVLENLPKLLDLNIASLKIEGRMKSAEYVGYVTRVYRGIIDDYYNGKTPNITLDQQSNLAKLFNRGYTKGYAFDSFGSDMMSQIRPNHKGVKIGDIIKTTHSKIHVKLIEKLNQHDGVKFEKTDSGFTCDRIYKNDLLVSSAEAGDVITLDNKDHLTKNEAVLKTRDHLFCQQLSLLDEMKIQISIKVIAKIGMPLCLSFYKDDQMVTLNGDVVSKAKNAPMTETQIKAQILKLGNTPFVCRNFNIESDDHIFIPKSELNKMRRNLCDQMIESLTYREKRKVSKNTGVVASIVEFDDAFGYSIFVRNSEQLKATKNYNFKRIYTDEYNLYSANTSKMDNLFFSIPRAKNASHTYKSKNLLIGDTGALLNNKNNNTVVCDYHINAINARSLAVLDQNEVSCITISPEMSDTDIKTMIKKYSATHGKNPNLELNVYGKYELMLIKNCIIASALKKKENCNLCKTNDYYLKDDRDNIYPIKTGPTCVNTLFASKNMCILQSKIKDYHQLNINSFRISLLDEDYEASIKVIRMFINA